MEQKSEETQTQQEPQETQQQAKKDRKYLVIDTSTFIKETQFDRFNASELYTVDEVLREVRDKKARKYLVSIPFRIKVREPSPEAIKAVISFAQKTGDYGSLSSTDIKVMALTYTFEAEQYGTANIRTSPKPVSFFFDRLFDVCLCLFMFVNVCLCLFELVIDVSVSICFNIVCRR